MDFGSLVSQLLEVVLALVGNQRWQGMLRAQLQPLLHLALGYMQMTAAQVRGQQCVAGGWGIRRMIYMRYMQVAAAQAGGRLHVCMRAVNA